VKKLPAAKVWSITPIEEEYPIGWLTGDMEELSCGGCVMPPVMLSRSLIPCPPVFTGSILKPEGSANISSNTSLTPERRCSELLQP